MPESSGRCQHYGGIVDCHRSHGLLTKLFRFSGPGGGLIARVAGHELRDDRCVRLVLEPRVPEGARHRRQIVSIRRRDNGPGVDCFVDVARAVGWFGFRLDAAVLVSGLGRWARRSQKQENWKITTPQEHGARARFSTRMVV